jgi:hypothetical protein
VLWPIDQAIDEECRASNEYIQSQRLPPEFWIYTSDQQDHWVNAVGRTQDEAWQSTELVEVRVHQGPTRKG